MSVVALKIWNIRYVDFLTEKLDLFYLKKIKKEYMKSDQMFMAIKTSQI